MLKLPFKEHYYEGVVSGSDVADAMGENHEKVFKTLVTVGKSGQHFVFMIPVDEELDLKKAAKAVKEKSVAMLHVSEINDITGYVRGGCSPVGMKKLFPTTYHSSIEALDAVIVSAGKIGCQVELAPEALIKLTRGRIADITAE